MIQVHESAFHRRGLNRARRGRLVKNGLTDFVDVTLKRPTAWSDLVGL